MKKAVKIRITGEVQGVGFRWGAKRKADELRVFGKAWNEPDGKVLIEAEGEGAAVDKFIAWCRKGPSFAQVEQFSLEKIEPTGYENFEIF